MGPVALNYRQDLFHGGNSVHNITPCSFLIVSVVNFSLFFWQWSHKRYSGSAITPSPTRRLEQKFRWDSFQLSRRAALRQISAYIHERRRRFQRGSFIFCVSNVSVPISKSSKKLKSRLDTPSAEALSSSFPAWSGFCCMGSSDRRLLPPYRIASNFFLRSKVLASHSSSRQEAFAQLASQLNYLLLLRALSWLHHSRRAIMQS